MSIVDIAQQQNITPQSFDVLNGMERVEDRDGKDFFLMPAGTSGEDARKAALMTYILNCGTDYGKNPQTDFDETPYSAAEVQRIADRQEANAWSYDKDVDFVRRQRRPVDDDAERHADGDGRQPAAGLLQRGRRQHMGRHLHGEHRRPRRSRADASRHGRLRRHVVPDRGR